MKKREYWNRKALFDTNGDYLIVYGQNCSGKSYQAKCEIIERALRGERFFYLRRWNNDLNQNSAEQYFADMPIDKLTGGRWTNIKAYQGYFHFENEETGKVEKSDIIGAYGSLNSWQKYKSRAYVNYTLIVFEEFITDGVYLDDETSLLMRLVTTVFRDHKGQVLMIGNSISRTVPYFMEWTPNVIKQRQGTIEIYHMKDSAGEGLDILIAVEYGGHIKGSGLMSFGEASKTILSGEWDVVNRPKLPKDYIDYYMAYEMAIKYMTFSFVLQLLIDEDTGTRILYIYPLTTNRKIERIITNTFSDDPNITNGFKSNKPELYIIECLKENKICFSDNLTGSDFESVRLQLNI